jgi:hypothetical protein
VDPHGRVFAYRGDLDDDAFRLACQLTVHAANRLEDLVARVYRRDRRTSFFLALASLSLDLLAADEADVLFLDAYDLAMRLNPDPDPPGEPGGVG